MQGQIIRAVPRPRCVASWPGSWHGLGGLPRPPREGEWPRARTHMLGSGPYPTTTCGVSQELYGRPSRDLSTRTGRSDCSLRHPWHRPKTAMIRLINAVHELVLGRLLCLAPDLLPRDRPSRRPQVVPTVTARSWGRSSRIVTRRDLLEADEKPCETRFVAVVSVLRGTSRARGDRAGCVNHAPGSKGEARTGPAGPDSPRARREPHETRRRAA